MKKVFALICTFALAFSLTACNNSERSENSESSVISTSSESISTSENSSESETSEISANVGEFDLENGTVLLNSGYAMPILGIGTFTLSNEQAENSVYRALRDGYRLIDTARIYGNEEGVGRGIQRAIFELTNEEMAEIVKLDCGKWFYTATLEEQERSFSGWASAD